MRKLHSTPDSTYVPLTNEPTGLNLFITTFDVVNGLMTIQTTIHADAGGYYLYEDYSSSHFVEENLLGYWFSTTAEDGQAFDLRIDLSMDGNPANDIHSNVVTVMIDNKKPDVELIDLGGVVDCADFNLGATFTSHYTVKDIHFKEFKFEIQPSGHANGILPTPPSGLSNHFGGTIPDPGVIFGTYSLNTAGMDACGYALILRVWDRTNVDSGSGYNSSQASVGFCLREPKKPT
jgi:hypothetical protein